MNRIQTSILIVVIGIVCGCHPMPAVQYPHDTRFTLIQTKAKEVFILTSLNRYAPVPMKKTTCGEWEVYLPEDVVFDYFFKVDGIPFTPDCRLQQTDDFGGRLCIHSPGISEP